MRTTSIGAMAVVAVVLISLLSATLASASLEIFQTSTAAFTTASSSGPTLVKQWSYQFGRICYRMVFGPSPAVADLGYGDENLEIITGNDEYYPQPYVSGRWFAFDANGNVLWTLDTGNDESRSSVAIADIDNDGDLEIAGGTTSGRQVQVFSHLGGMVWRYNTGGMVHSSPAIADIRPEKPGLEVVAASYDGKVYAFDSSGNLIWSTYIYTANVSSPAVGDVDGDGKLEVVVGTRGYKIYVLDGATGSTEWTYSVDTSVYSSAALANLDSDNALEVVIGAGYNVLSIDGATGTLEWKFVTGGVVYSSPAIGDVDADGIYEVIVGSDDRKIYSLDATTGTLEWAYPTEGTVRSSAALADRGTGGLAVYIGSYDKYLYLIDGKTGTLIDRFLTSGPITSSPVIADIDGDQKLEILFMDWNQAGGNRDYFWALEDTGSVVTKYAIEWGMFRHDERRTGLYPMRYILDTTPPTSLVNTITPYWQSTTSFTITATASDNLSGVAKVELFYRYSSDNLTWGPWVSFDVDNESPWSWSFTASNGDGYYEFYSVATDNAGNVELAPAVADAACGVDTTLPESSVNAIEPYWQNSTPFTITATATDQLSGTERVELFYRYSSDNASWNSLTYFGVDDALPWSWSFTAPEGDGYYEFYSAATDVAGNKEAPAAFPADGQEIIVNGDFSTGDATGWTFAMATGSGILGNYQIVNNAARIYRTGAGSYGRGSWLYQDLNVNVSNATALTLSFKVRVDYQSLSGFGAADTEPPAYVQISYLDANGQERYYWRGFYYTGTSSNPNGEKISQSTWVSRSYDLTTLSPTPATIKRAYIVASGWDYDSSFDDVRLVYTTGEIEADARTGVDTTPPESSVYSISPYWRDSTTIALTATATDALSGVASVTLYYRHSADNVTFTPWAEVATDTAAPWEWTLDLTENTYYEFYSVARDVAGNVEVPPASADASCAIRRVILAMVRFKPEVIDLNSKGVFTAFISLPEGYSVADIDPSTVACEGALVKSWEITEQGELAVKFRVQDLGVEPGTTMLVVTGRLTDGTEFIGGDYIIGTTNPSQGDHLQTPPTPPPDQPAVTIEDLLGGSAGGSETVPAESTTSSDNDTVVDATPEDTASGNTTGENTLGDIPTDSVSVDNTTVTENISSEPTAPADSSFAFVITPPTEDTTTTENVTSPASPTESTASENLSTSSDSVAVADNSSSATAPTSEDASTSTENTGLLENASIGESSPVENTAAAEDASLPGDMGSAENTVTDGTPDSMTIVENSSLSTPTESTSENLSSASENETPPESMTSAEGSTSSESTAPSAPTTTEDLASSPLEESVENLEPAESYSSTTDGTLLTTGTSTSYTGSSTTSSGGSGTSSPTSSTSYTGSSTASTTTAPMISSGGSAGGSTSMSVASPAATENAIAEPEENDNENLEAEPEEPEENSPASPSQSHGSHSSNGKLKANVKIEPDVVEIGGKGKLTASIELPPGHRAADIDPSTISIRGKRTKRGGVVGEKFVAEFDVEDLPELMLGETELTVTGELMNGTSFEGSDLVVGVVAEAPKTEFVSSGNGMPLGTLLAMLGLLLALFGGSIVGYIMREMRRQVRDLTKDLERSKLAQNPAKEVRMR